MGSPGAACRTRQRTARRTQTRRKDSHSNKRNSPENPTSSQYGYLRSVLRANKTAMRQPQTTNPPTQTAAPAECRRGSGSRRRAVVPRAGSSEWNRSGEQTGTRPCSTHLRTTPGPGRNSGVGGQILRRSGRGGHWRAHPGGRQQTAPIRAWQTWLATARRQAPLLKTRIRGATRRTPDPIYETGRAHPWT